MSFPCPGCDAPLDARPDRLLMTCASCGARLRGRSVETDGESPAFEVQVVGRPETARRVELTWTHEERRRLATWLGWASFVTVALVLVLYVLARLL